MIRLLLADDHQAMIDGLVAICSSAPDVEVVATANNGAEVLEYLKKQPVDVVLIDINMPVLNGVETCKRIRSKFVNTRVLAFSMYAQLSYVRRLMQYGASGYVLKNDPADEILEGVRRVAQGQTFFSAQVRALGPLTRPVKESRYFDAVISKRELEVLRLISDGLTDTEVADRLSLSAFTVSSHRKSLLLKLDVRNSVELVKVAMEKGLI